MHLYYEYLNIRLLYTDIIDITKKFDLNKILLVRN